MIDQYQNKDGYFGPVLFEKPPKKELGLQRLVTQNGNAESIAAVLHGCRR